MPVDEKVSGPPVGLRDAALDVAECQLVPLGVVADGLFDGLPVDPETAEIVESSGSTYSLIEDLETRIRLLEQDLDKKRREIERLKLDKERQRRTHAHRLLIEGIFNEWVEVAGKRKGTKLGSRRFDAIAARVAEDRERWHFSLAIYGGVKFPITSPDGTVHADIEIIMRDEVRFEKAAARCLRFAPEVAEQLRPRVLEDSNETLTQPNTIPTQPNTA